MLRRFTLVVLVLVSLPAVATAGTPVAAPSAADAATSAIAADAAKEAGATDVAASTAVDAMGPSGESTSRVGNESAEETIVRSVELSLTPDEPGTYQAVVRYELPEAVSELSVSLGDEATVTSKTGFEQSGTNAYDWTGSTNEPTLRLRVDANETSAGRRGDAPTSPTVADGVGSGAGADAAVDARGADPAMAAAGEGFVFVDPGPWALVRTPRIGTRWRWTGTGSVSLAKRTSVDGPGATGGEMAYMGPVTRYNATGRDERFQLVVPDRAELNSTPDAILDTFTTASERLRVGARSDEVFVIAAPDDADWGVGGLQYGADDAWVLADSPVDTVDNVWLHEYVHTRQTFTTTDSGKWVTEATAEYYASLLASEQGLGTYDAFQRKLALGQRDRYGDDVLAVPRTWSDGANYLKGGLATGAIDLRIRQGTDGSATFQSVFRELNRYEGPVSNDVFLDAVDETAGADVREYAAGLSETDRTAETWSEATHSENFGALPAVFEYRLGDGAVTASGVVGERTLGDRSLAGNEIVLARGETLRADLTVANVGWEAGDYAATVTLDGDVLAKRTGRLEADATTTETVRRTFDETGTYRLDLADTRVTVRVVEPASPTVERVDAPATAAVGENVTFTVSIRNSAAVPGNTTIPFGVDDERIGERTYTVPAESSISRTYSVTFSTPGEHTIRVGDTTVTVDVTGDATREATDEPGDPTALPGFDPTSAIAALLATIALAALARRRRD